MIQLYNPDNTNYENNGDIILLPVKCEETAGINRTWQIDIEHPIDEEGRWKYIVIDAVIKCPSINGIQLWRVVQTEKRDSGVIATCDPIFYDAAKETIITSRITLNDKTCQEALDILCEGTGFSGTSTIEGVKSTWYEWENLVEVMTGNEHGLVKTYDGEIAFDNYTVHIESELGGDYGVSVMYGKNLPVDGISESVNIDGTFTRIIPVAYNGYTLPELYVDSEFIDDYPTPRIGIIHYDNLRLWSDREEGEQGDSTTEYYNSKEELYEAMREAAAKEYTENEIDRPSVSLEVEMVLLQNTEEYKDYQELESVNIGDYVRCYNPRLGIDTKTRVRSITYDCIRERVTFVELGKEKRNYFDNVTSLIERIEGAITPGGGIVAEKVQGFLNGAWTQLRVQNTIAQHQDVRAILFEDLNPESPTFGALSIGTQGWEISRQRTQDGRDWIWTTAATAGGIIANTIVTGLLSDKLGRNYWNLDTGDFSLTGATIDGYATDEELTTGVNGAKTYADGKANTAETNAKTYADGKATTAEANAKSYADTKSAAAITAANGYSDSVITNYDTALNQQKVFNKLTNNGAAQGILLTNGQLYINATYINTGTLNAGIVTTGTLQDQAGRNFWNLTTGEFSLTGYATDSELTTGINTAKTYADGVGTSTLNSSKTYADGVGTSTLNSSKTYADGVGTSTLSSANSYTDSEIADYDSDLNQLAVFNKLTNNQANQGIYLQNGRLYINASMINSGSMSADRISGGTITGVTISGNTITGGTVSGATLTSYVTGTTKGVEISSGAINVYNGSGTFQGIIRGGRSADSNPGVGIGGSDVIALGDYNSSTGAISSMIYRSKSNDQTALGTSRNWHISLNGSTGTTTIAGRNSSNSLTTTRITISGDDDYATMSGTWHLNGPLQVSDGGTWTSGYTGNLNTEVSGRPYVNRYVRGLLVSSSSDAASFTFTFQTNAGPFAGHVTSSGAELVFFIPAYASLYGRTSATWSGGGTIEVRTTEGGYLDSTASLSTSSLTKSVTPTNSGFRVSMKKSSAFGNVTNNTPVTVLLKASTTIVAS